MSRSRVCSALGAILGTRSEHLAHHVHTACVRWPMKAALLLTVGRRQAMKGRLRGKAVLAPGQERGLAIGEARRGALHPPRNGHARRAEAWGGAIGERRQLRVDGPCVSAGNHAKGGKDVVHRCGVHVNWADVGEPGSDFGTTVRVHRAHFGAELREVLAGQPSNVLARAPGVSTVPHCR